MLLYFLSPYFLPFTLESNEFVFSNAFSMCCAHNLAPHQDCLLQAWLSSGVTSSSLSMEHAPSSEVPQSFSCKF